MLNTTVLYTFKISQNNSEPHRLRHWCHPHSTMLLFTCSMSTRYRLYYQYLECVVHFWRSRKPFSKWSIRLTFGTQYLHVVIKALSKFQPPSTNTAQTLTYFVRHQSSTLPNFDILNFNCPLYAYRARYATFIIYRWGRFLTKYKTLSKVTRCASPPPIHFKST